MSCGGPGAQNSEINTAFPLTQCIEWPQHDEQVGPLPWLTVPVETKSLETEYTAVR